MKVRDIPIDDLASELFADVTRVDLSLTFYSTVLTPFLSNEGFLHSAGGAYNHLVVSTLTLSFMGVARLFDCPKSRRAVTLESLVKRLGIEKAGHPRIDDEAKRFLKQIETTRLQIAKLRNNVFAHKSYQQEAPRVSWQELEEARDLAKTIMDWYGQYMGHAYNFRVPGFQVDCKRFVEGQWKAFMTQNEVSGQAGQQ